MNRRYPQLEIDLSALRSNAQHIVRRCHERHIRVCGVVKGADGLPEVARALRQCGADELGTSPSGTGGEVPRRRYRPGRGC